MSFFHRNSAEVQGKLSVVIDCLSARSSFSAYLDGVVTGHEMAAIASHLRSCPSCAKDFAVWQSMGTALADLGPARAPENLQSRLRSLAAAERVQGKHLSVSRRLALLWQGTLAPLALRTAGGLAFAASLAFFVGWVFGPAAAVQANDDRMAHYTAPRYLYSQMALQPVATGHDAPVLIDAKVDDRGRVYDFELLEGPTDPAVQIRIQANLLASVFKPASLFGEPVRGHVILTYAGVSARP